MFILQQMYADGLVKILATITVANGNKVAEQRAVINSLMQEVSALGSAEAAIRDLTHSASLGTVRRELCKRNLQLGQAQAQLANSEDSRDAAIIELQKIGIEQHQYEEKFRLIAKDCIRISHGSVRPPQWRQA